MAKYIHIDEEDGKIDVRLGQTTGYLGWIYKVPNNYDMKVTLADMDGHTTIDELLDNDERAVLVYTNN